MFKSTLAPSLHSSLPAVARRAVSALDLVRELVRAMINRGEVRRLIELDDRALKDIGLLRSDVDGALATPFYRDPSTVLLVRAVERRARARTLAPVRRASETITAKPACPTC